MSNLLHTKYPSLSEQARMFYQRNGYEALRRHAMVALRVESKPRCRSCFCCACADLLLELDMQKAKEEREANHV